MKRDTSCRILAIAVLVVGSSLVVAQDPSGMPPLTSQSQSAPNASASTAPASQQDSTSAPEFTGQEMQDKRFIREIVQGSLAEVRMGQLAATRASSDDVKAFGARMVTDHTELGKQMAPVADSFGMRLPKDLSKADQEQIAKLDKLSGEAFDREYISITLMDHRRDLRAFRQEAMATHDNTLRNEIDRSAGILRDHMGTLIQLAKDKGIAIPQRASRADAVPTSQPQ